MRPNRERSRRSDGAGRTRSSPASCRPPFVWRPLHSGSVLFSLSITPTQRAWDIGNKPGAGRAGPRLMVPVILSDRTCQPTGASPGGRGAEAGRTCGAGSRSRSRTTCISGAVRARPPRDREVPASIRRRGRPPDPDRVDGPPRLRARAATPRRSPSRPPRTSPRDSRPRHAPVYHARRAHHAAPERDGRRR